MSQTEVELDQFIANAAGSDDDGVRPWNKEYPDVYEYSPIKAIADALCEVLKGPLREEEVGGDPQMIAAYELLYRTGGEDHVDLHVLHAAPNLLPTGPTPSVNSSLAHCVQEENAQRAGTSMSSESLTFVENMNDLTVLNPCPNHLFVLTIHRYRAGKKFFRYPIHEAFTRGFLILNLQGLSHVVYGKGGGPGNASCRTTLNDTRCKNML